MHLLEKAFQSAEEHDGTVTNVKSSSSLSLNVGFVLGGASSIIFKVRHLCVGDILLPHLQQQAVKLQCYNAGVCSMPGTDIKALLISSKKT